MNVQCRHIFETWPDGQVRCFECDEAKPMSADFTRLAVRDARAEARKRGASIPKGLHAYRVATGGNPWYEVRDKAGRVVWGGSASDAFEARANAIDSIQ